MELSILLTTSSKVSSEGRLRHSWRICNSISEAALAPHTSISKGRTMRISWIRGVSVCDQSRARQGSLGPLACKCGQPSHGLVQDSESSSLIGRYASGNNFGSRQLGQELDGGHELSNVIGFYRLTRD